LFRLNRTRRDRGYDLRVEAFAGTPTSIDFGKDEFVLAAQVSQLPGALAFAFKAEPTAVDLSGRWNMTEFVTTDIEGSDAFWALVQKQYGLDKSALIASSNSELEQASSYLVLTKTADEPLYTIEISSTKGSGTLVFKDVPVVNNHLQAAIKYNGLDGEISLTVNGNKMTGAFRSQVVLHVGDQSESAIQVVSMTAVRAE
jgi:hypothetical protein